MDFEFTAYTVSSRPGIHGKTSKLGWRRGGCVINEKEKNNLWTSQDTVIMCQVYSSTRGGTWSFLHAKANTVPPGLHLQPPSTRDSLLFTYPVTGHLKLDICTELA